jgi:hypothetical protein
MEWLDQATEFLSRLDWVRVFFTILLTGVAIVAGVWYPARVLERYTNQVALRYIWYVAGTLMLIMVYVSLYGYGHFWELYSAGEIGDQTGG